MNREKTMKTRATPVFDNSITDLHFIAIFMRIVEVVSLC